MSPLRSLRTRIEPHTVLRATQRDVPELEDLELAHCLLHPRRALFGAAVLSGDERGSGRARGGGATRRALEA